ncbi:MAG: hypothetical protein J6C46_09785 [Clostridia bacterium]|nr:hypothetical protein [Clostridia bacterium]
MKLPEEILDKIIEISYDMNKKDMAQNFRKISDRYMGEKEGKSLLNKENEAIVYSIARMPATYSAVYSAFNQVIKTLEYQKCPYTEKNEKTKDLPDITTLLDVGAGTGAASLAISEKLRELDIDLENITCLERENVMINLGKTLFSESEINTIKNASWIQFDINQTIDNSIDSLKSDVVVTSYMLNEFDKEKVLTIVDKLWNMTRKILIIVEPGTPKDHERIINIKNHLVQNGAKVIAPCTCQIGCPLPEDDWCNYTCRVERTKLQKDVKSGEVPYEDEKFTYLAVMKESGFEEKIDSNKKMARIIRHPIIRSNLVEVKMCSDGQVVNKIYTKKDKDVYKSVKKAKVGDIIY